MYTFGKKQGCGPSFFDTEYVSSIPYAGLDTERLDRVMQCAVALGIFAQAQGSHKDGIRYRNTPVSAVLRETHPKSVHNLV